MRVTVFRDFAGTGVLVAAVLLSSCSGSDDPDAGAESIKTQAESVLHPTGAGVASVDATQTPVDGDAGADPLDADHWAVDINVVMTEQATADQVASAATSTRAFSKQYVGSGRWTAHVTVGGIEPVAGDDRTEPAPVQVEIYPKVRVSAAADARAAMAVKALRGVDGVAIAGGVADVRVGKAGDLPGVVTSLRRLPLWKDGGNLDAEAGRIRLSDVPERVTSTQLEAIVRAGVAHPQADLALESSGRSPELYVNHMTLAEGRKLASALTDPALARRDADGFELEFNVRTTDADKTVDIHGTFGRPRSL